MADLGWGKEAAELYADLEGAPRKANELEAVDQVLDAIEDDPVSDRVRETSLTAADGRRIWKVTNSYRNSDLMAVLWEMREGQPIVVWLGDADYGM